MSLMLFRGASVLFERQCSLEIMEALEGFSGSATS